jgi:hypothetical protein
MMQPSRGLQKRTKCTQKPPGIIGNHKTTVGSS